MQLTNIARDVVEDDKKNRIYLIKNSTNILDDIKNLIMKAETFYNSSFVGLKDIPLNSRFSIIVARRVYRQIGRKILKKKDIESYKKRWKNLCIKFWQVNSNNFFFIGLDNAFFFTRSKKYEKESEYNLINEDIALNERI